MWRVTVNQSILAVSLSKTADNVVFEPVATAISTS